MKTIITAFLLVFVVHMSISQEKMDYFLPDDVTYKKDIPTPEDFFGQKLGEWHLTHGQVLYYIKEIARLSDRAILDEYARSWENRPLVHLIFTAEKNLSKLDELKALHKKHADPDENLSSEISTVIFRIFQETLTNIIRHSEATDASVSLFDKSGSIILEVKDNGKGITKKQISDSKSFGIIGIKERIRPWNGRVEISGKKGKGTIVTVTLPSN